MSDEPSKEALETACALIYGRDHLWDDPDLKERDIALALDRFRAAPESDVIARLRASLERTRASLRLLIAEVPDPGSEALAALWEAGDLLSRVQPLPKEPA